MIKFCISLLFCCLAAVAFGQQTSDKWDLKRMVEYAMKNNISVKQAAVEARIAALQYKQNKLSAYPNANFNGNMGMQFGRSIDPTTNQFTQTQLLFNSFGLNTGINVFNWGQLKNTIASSKLQAEASLTDVERAANDIALNVASFYLNVLGNQQQMSIAKTQIQLTQEQLQITRKRVSAGALPELNALELESRLAQDSIGYFNALNNYEQSVINLKGLLNLDMTAPFEIDMPPLDKIPVLPLAELDPAVLYKTSLNELPQQKVANLRIKASELSVKATKAGMYPTISVGGGLATNFAASTNKITGFTLGAAQPTGQFVNVGGTDYLVLEPTFNVTQGKKSFSEVWQGYGRQLDNNFRQNIGVQINVPIFNGGSARINYERSKLTLQQTQLAKVTVDQNLQRDIYAAYNNAVAALQRYNASLKSVDIAQKSYDMAVKRYNVGMINTLDLITNQNNLTQAKLTLLTNQYDYVFRMKLLEFYRGKGLVL